MRNVWPVFFLIIAACAAPTPVATATATPPPFYTATLAPTLTPRPTATPLPPTEVPTATPVEGTITAQVNVRATPGQDAASLGLLNPQQKVQVIGKSANSAWWMITYPSSPTGTGWVTVAYVTISGDPALLPVTDVVAATSPPGAPAAPAASSIPGNPAAATKTGVTTQQINIRAGPASTYDSLGLLEKNTSVTITGRNETNSWVQIEYTPGPESRGWVAALYLQLNNSLDGLPVFDNQGKLKSLATPQATIGPSPTATIISPAAVDGDSREAPAASVTFSPDQISAFIYSSDLSSPNGDSEDWVTFTPYSPVPSQATYVYMRLDCSGNGNITVELRTDGAPVPDFQGLVCFQYDVAVRVLGGKTYQLGLHADGTATDLRYVRYTIKIETAP